MLILLLLASFSPLISALSDRQRLRSLIDDMDLMKNPFEDQDETGHKLRLKMTVEAASLLKVLENEAVCRWDMTTTYEYWNPLWGWNASLYGGIEKMEVNATWLPPLKPCVHIDWSKKDDGADLITLWHNGTIRTNLNVIINGRCNMNFARLPHDTHTCSPCFSLATAGQYFQELDVKLADDMALLTDTTFRMSSNVTITRYNHTQGDVRMVQVGISITFSRIPEYYLKSNIVPMFIINLIFLGGTTRGNLLANFLAFAAIVITESVYFQSNSLPRQGVFPALGSLTFALLSLDFVVVVLQALLQMCLTDDDDATTDTKDKKQTKPETLATVIVVGDGAPVIQNPSGAGGAMDILNIEEGRTSEQKMKDNKPSTLQRISRQVDVWMAQRTLLKVVLAPLQLLLLRPTTYLWGRIVALWDLSKTKKRTACRILLSAIAVCVAMPLLYLGIVVWADEKIDTTPVIGYASHPGEHASDDL